MRIGFSFRVTSTVCTLLLVPPIAGATCGTGGAVDNEYLVRASTTFPLSICSSFSGSWSKLIARGVRIETVSSKPKESRTWIAGKPHAPSHPALYLVEASPVDIAEIARHPEVLSVEQNCIVHLKALPNDPVRGPNVLVNQIVGLEHAWDIRTDATPIVIAISDTGVDYRHEDLNSNMWVNTIEKDGIPGVDDDQNGCIDDVYGCDLADSDGDPAPGSMESSSHGTHVAGIAGAIGNNAIGVTGASWKVRLMAVKGFKDTSETSNLSDLLKTVYYAADNGARILNASWGTNRTPTLAERDAFAYAIEKGVVPIVAAGNESRSAELGSPSGIPGVITIGASNSLDNISAFSNFGPAVDLLAPGGDSFAWGGIDEFIVSTIPGGYGSEHGTSMSAPLVSGVVALMLAIHPKLGVSDVHRILIESADQIQVRPTALQGDRFTYPRLNAQRALQRALMERESSNEVDSCKNDKSDCESRSEVEFANRLEAQGPGFGCGFKLSRGQSTEKQWLFAILMIPIVLVGSFRLRP